MYLDNLTSSSQSTVERYLPGVVAVADVVYRLTAECIVAEADLLILPLLHFKLGIRTDVLKEGGPKKIIVHYSKMRLLTFPGIGNFSIK